MIVLLILKSHKLFNESFQNTSDKTNFSVCRISTLKRHFDRSYHLTLSSWAIKHWERRHINAWPWILPASSYFRGKYICSNGRRKEGQKAQSSQTSFPNFSHLDWKVALRDWGKQTGTLLSQWKTLNLKIENCSQSKIVYSGRRGTLIPWGHVWYRHSKWRSLRWDERTVYFHGNLDPHPKTGSLRWVKIRSYSIWPLSPSKELLWAAAS